MVADGNTTGIGALLIVAAGGISAWVTKWFDRRKTDADVAGLVQGTYSALVRDLHEELERQEAKCAQQLAALESRMQAKIDILTEEVKRLRTETNTP